MPRQRFYNLAPSSRAELLGIASRHFAARGLKDASLNEILAEAGISKGAYYYYFDDKDDLFATTLEWAIDEILARLPMPDFNRLTHETFWPTVERFVGKWATVFDLSNEIVQAAAQLSEAQRQSPRYAPVFAKGQDIYTKLIEPGQKLGCIRSDLPIEVLVRLLQASDSALDSLFAANPGKVTRERLNQHVKLVFDTFKRLLIKEPFGNSMPEESRRRRARRS